MNIDLNLVPGRYSVNWCYGLSYGPDIPTLNVRFAGVRYHYSAPLLLRQLFLLLPFVAVRQFSLVLPFVAVSEPFLSGVYLLRYVNMSIGVAFTQYVNLIFEAAYL